MSIENSYKGICKRKRWGTKIIEQEYGVLPMSTLPATTQPTRRIDTLVWQVVQLVPVPAMRFGNSASGTKACGSIIKWGLGQLPRLLQYPISLIGRYFSKSPSAKSTTRSELFWRLFRHANLMRSFAFRRYRITERSVGSNYMFTLWNLSQAKSFSKLFAEKRNGNYSDSGCLVSVKYSTE